MYAPSLPSRERGLKYWDGKTGREMWRVAPLAGARIEINKMLGKGYVFMSLPSRERGLKFVRNVLTGVVNSRSPRGSAD